MVKKTSQHWQPDLLEPTLPLALPVFVPAPLGAAPAERRKPEPLPFTFSVQDPAARAVGAVKVEEPPPILLRRMGHA